MLFSQVVKMKTQGCAKCFSVIYTLPCALDANIEGFLKIFGLPMYRLDTVKLLRIDSKDEFHIEGKIGSKTIKFAMPKKYEKVEINKIARKTEFEKCLAAWLSSALKIQITM